MRDLVPYLGHVAIADGVSPTALPFMRVNRRSRSGTPHAHVLQPGIGIFVAGDKLVGIGNRRHIFRRGDVIATSRATTVTSRIVRAPYLCAMLSIDVDLITSLMSFPRSKSSDITEPFARLVRLLASPSEIPVLAPLFQRELFYRLLAGPSGDTLRDLAHRHDAAVSGATAWLDAHFAEPFSAERLAAHVHLSVSALYARFKARLRITPLQYQKRRRLETARRLLLTDDTDVGDAAHRVGYASAAQFSRDYRRAFAISPRQDIDLTCERARDRRKTPRR